MKRNYFHFLLLLFLCAGAASPQEYRIRKISFNGFKHISSGAARKTMLTKSPSSLLWNKKPVFNEMILRQDIRNITSYCRNEGFFDASADYSLKFKNHSVDINITVKEGLPYYVESATVTVIDNTPAVLPGNLINKTAVKTGKVFKIEQFNKTKKEFSDYLKKSGYGSASVNGKLIIDRAAHTASVIISVLTGPLQFFGGTTVKNNNYVKPEYIIAEATFKEGDKFLLDELENTRENIYGLDLFRLVTVNPAASTGTIIPVEINVSEKKQWNVKIGLGYGTEDNGRLQGTLSKYYLFDKPRTLTLSAKFSTIISNLTASIAQPFFINRKTGLTGSFSMVRENITSYTNEKLAGLAKINRKYLDTLNAFAAYNLEVDRPRGIKVVATAEELKATQPDKFYFISGLLFGISYNSMKTIPLQNGVIYSLLLEPASYLLGSEIDYIKGALEGQNFLKLSDSIAFVARVKYGFILPQRNTAEIPIFKRFFSGGSYSVRGYGFHEIGPADINGTPLGGHYLLEYSIELQQHLSPQSNFILFLDAGEVYNTSYSSSELRYGTGIGIRYSTPIGPLGLDLGFPVISGNKVGLNQYKLYFSLGQTF